MRLALALVLVAACVEPAPDPTPGFDAVAKPPPPGEKDQGRYLNGSVSDPLAAKGYHLHTTQLPAYLPTTAGSVTRIEAGFGSLTAYSGATTVFSGADTRFIGIELPLVDSTSRLRITGISSTPGMPYILDIVTNGVLTPYCVDHGPAYASPGRWTIGGAHEVAERINFTCTDGVIHKCVSWGYDPGIAPLGGPANEDPWRVHQACTRMARADRCGVGEPNTYEETAILIRDRVVGGQPNIDDLSVPPLRFPTMDPPTANTYWFESAWTEDGAICLSRERWKSMPLDEDSCLPDPRKTAGVKTCDQIGVDTLKTTATFFNGSKVGQLYLNRWHKGSDQLVTVRGVAGENGREEPPYTGYLFDEQIGLLMRNPPGSLDLPGTADPDLAVVAQYRAGTDRVVSATAPTATHTLVGPEGFVYTRNDAGTYLELRLYQSGADYVSSTAPPTATGWTDLGVLGYIDPP